MSENETNQKVETKYDRKMEKRKKEQEKENKSQKRGRIIAIVIILLCLIGVGAVIFTRYQKVSAAYITVDDEKISKTEFDYYFNVVFNNYQEMYGSYIGYLGLDVTADLYAQEYSEDMSWGDYFEEMAIDLIKETKALVKDAEDAGFTYDVDAEYDKFRAKFDEDAAKAGVSSRTYCRNLYGDYATPNRIKPMIKDSILYSAYYEEKSKSIHPTEQEIADYYNENKEAFDLVDYRFFTMPAEYEKPEEGEAVSDEVLEKAMKEAKEKAEKFADEVKEGKAFNDVCKEYAEEDDTAYEEENGSLVQDKPSSQISSQYRDWLFDEERKAGDITCVEDIVNNRYYIVAFEGRHRNEALSANVRFIVTASADGKSIVQEWKDGEATEESFTELVEKYSEGEKENGGLIENVTSGAVLFDIKDWMFGEKRTAGDITSIVAANGNNFVLYYVGDGDPQWHVEATNRIINETMLEYVEDLKDACVVKDVRGEIRCLEAGAEQDTESEE